MELGMGDMEGSDIKVMGDMDGSRGGVYGWKVRDIV